MVVDQCYSNATAGRIKEKSDQGGAEQRVGQKASQSYAECRARKELEPDGNLFGTRLGQGFSSSSPRQSTTIVPPVRF